LETVITSTLTSVSMFPRAARSWRPARRGRGRNLSSPSPPPRGCRSRRSWPSTRRRASTARRPTAPPPTTGPASVLPRLLASWPFSVLDYGYGFQNRPRGGSAAHQGTAVTARYSVLLAGIEHPAHEPVQRHAGIVGGAAKALAAVHLAEIHQALGAAAGQAVPQGNPRRGGIDAHRLGGHGDVLDGVGEAVHPHHVDQLAGGAEGHRLVGADRHAVAVVLAEYPVDGLEVLEHVELFADVRGGHQAALARAVAGIHPHGLDQFLAVGVHLLGGTLHIVEAGSGAGILVPADDIGGGAGGDLLHRLGGGKRGVA